jgi:glutamine amidotransferase
MHNGFIGKWNRVRRHVEALIPDEMYPSRVGTTDSEAVFLAIMGNGIDRDPIGATADVLAKLTSLVSDDEVRDPLRFTAALSNGRDLYAFRYAVNDRANTLYYQMAQTGVVIVSEPLDREHANWIPVPESSVIVVRAGKPPEVLATHIYISITR